MSFQAYGRQFDLTLESNERLFAALPASQREALRAYPVYRGRVAGMPGSWVRLTRVGDALEGMIWDGNDLYTIEPARRAKRFMIDAAGVADDATVIYRLSDTLSDLGPQFCTVVTPAASATALDAYKALVSELRANQPLAAAAAVTGQIQVAVVGDSEFSSDHPTDAESTVVSRMNIVDGIFSDQVGIHIVAASVNIFASANDPFSATTVPGDLLNELANYKEATAAIRSTAITHMMTGRDFDGSTVGIAFLASLCSPRFGVSVSQGGAEISSASAALVAAHEMGHNFGAPHDAESDATQNQACASTPPTFLMAGRLNGSSTFSQCSLDQMQPEISAAACVQPVSTADAAVSRQPCECQQPHQPAARLRHQRELDRHCRSQFRDRQRDDSTVLHAADGHAGCGQLLGRGRQRDLQFRHARQLAARDASTWSCSAVRRERSPVPSVSRRATMRSRRTIRPA